MTNLISFSFESSEIRTLTIDGNPWFVGKDACDALAYKDTVNALKQHCRGVVKYHPIVDRLGRTQEVRIINEPDIYRLITGSTLPEAERFERWLFEEVLPSIRKTGRYAAPDFRDPLSDFGPKAQFAVLEMLVGKVAKEIAAGFVDYLRAKPEWAASPPDPWEAQARAFLADRSETTTTELLAHCGIEPGDQTQSQKNRAAKLLKYLGYRANQVKRNRIPLRVWQRGHHG